MVEEVLRPHLEAVRASVAAGFRFQHLPTRDNVLALHGYRVRFGAMDMYRTLATDDALAARFRLEDLEHRSPSVVWHRHGTVVDVVSELLALPAHGTPGAPVLAVRAPSDLWTLRDTWS